MSHDLELMDTYDEYLLNTIPDSKRKSNIIENYIQRIKSLSYNQLDLEHHNIFDKKRTVQNEIEKLVEMNNSNLLDGIDCLKSTRDSLAEIENKICSVGKLTDNFPLNQLLTVSKFSDQSKNMAALLSNSNQIIDLLETPKLISVCTKNGFYEDALLLKRHVENTLVQYPDLKILGYINQQINRNSTYLCETLIIELNTKAYSLSKTTSIINILKQISNYNEIQILMIFLKFRQFDFNKAPSMEKTTDTIQILFICDEFRNDLFDSIIKYRSSFTTNKECKLLFNGWLKNQLINFNDYVTKSMNLLLKDKQWPLIKVFISRINYLVASLKRMNIDASSLICYTIEKCVAIYLEELFTFINKRFVENTKDHGFDVSRLNHSSLSNMNNSSNEQQMLESYQPLYNYLLDLADLFNGVWLTLPSINIYQHLIQFLQQSLNNLSLILKSNLNTSLKTYIDMYFLPKIIEILNNNLNITSIHRSLCLNQIDLQTNDSSSDTQYTNLNHNQLIKAFKEKIAD